MGLGYQELILIFLVMFLLLLGVRSIPNLARGMAEAIRDFQNQFGGRDMPNLTRGMEEAIRRFQSQLHGDWRKPAQQEGEPVNIWPFVMFLLALIVVPIAMSLLKSETVTVNQLIVLAAVLSSWAAVGYFCFGRSKKDE